MIKKLKFWQFFFTNFGIIFLKMNETLTFRVKNENNEDVLVTIDARIASMSQPIEENEKDEIIPLLLKKSILEKIASFYELYNYNVEELKLINFEILSDNLLQNLGTKNYSFFSEFFDGENTLNMDKFKPLMEASYHYNFKYLSELCDVAVGTEFYCFSSEEALEGFKKKFNLPELGENEIAQLIDDNREAFDNLNKEFQKKLANLLLEEENEKNINFT